MLQLLKERFQIANGNNSWGKGKIYIRGDLLLGCQPVFGDSWMDGFSFFLGDYLFGSSLETKTNPSIFCHLS